MANETFGMPTPPDPFSNRSIVFVYPALLKYPNLCHPRHPDTYNINLIVRHVKGDEILDDLEFTLNENNITASCWDAVIETINLYYDVTGPNTLLVSIHNLALIQRAAWWWSRRHLLPDPDWNANHVQRDMVNLYNGPAIITAEERFSFDLNMACISLGHNTFESDEDHSTKSAQFTNFIKLWNLLKS